MALAAVYADTDVGFVRAIDLGRALRPSIFAARFSVESI
jgi:hypothetical protein